MAMGTMGATADRAALKPFVDLASNGRGLANSEIVEAFKAQDVKSKIRAVEGGLSELQAVTARGTPVIARVTSHGSATGWHAVIVDGVTSKPGIGQVVAIRDPAGKGSQMFIKAATFMKKWDKELVVPIKDWLP
jgi:hypothetical protein